MAGAITREKARIEKEAVRIPEDVIVEILKRFPVKSLLRFRCACKTWYSLISDPGFCNKLHQKRASVLIFEKSMYSTVTIEKPSIRSTPLSFPWQPEPGSISKLLGSCNGLVCVYYHSSPDHDRNGLILWNPSTRKFRKLPSSTSPRRDCGIFVSNRGIFYGFGYDELNDDYKFVWMTCENQRIPQARVEFDVFSLKSNTWSSFDHCHPSNTILSVMDTYTEYHNGVLSNGAIHWVVCFKGPSSSGAVHIHALDLSSEKYRLLEFPQEFELGSVVVSLSGCLCLCSPYPRPQGSGIDLWIMKEYGVDSSWLKLVSISLDTFYPIHFWNDEGNNIVAVVKCGTGCGIMMFQVEKGAVVSSETLVSGSGECGDNVSAMDESLVSVN